MIKKEASPYRLMTPGPVPLTAEVLAELSRPMIHHRTPEFSAILSRVLSELKYVFQTKMPVQVLTATGSGAMEAAIVNLFSPGDEILCVDSGKFGERWADMAEIYGLKVTRLKLPWGEALKPADILSALSQNPKLRAVLTQVCETSTATLHPIKELALALRGKDCLLVVDAITAIGATPLAMDDWGLDAVIAGSQKAFSLPTGLSFIALSERAWQAQAQSRLPKYYFDLKRERDMNAKEQTYFSSNVALIRALEPVLDEFKKFGLEHFQSRCARLAEATRTAGRCLGLEVFSKSPSPSVTALLVPKGIQGEAWRDLLENEYNITLMGGQDQLKGKILRIGHLGAISDEDLIETMRALGLSLQQLGLSSLSKAQVEESVRVTQQVLSRG